MFSNWVRWQERNRLSDIKCPGVYVIAISERDLNDSEFGWIGEIKYIGMTNSMGGLKSRLQQFENTISGKEGHGGARRFRFRYKNYDELVKRLYVSVRPFRCDVKSNNEQGLVTMGKVAEFEYICLAEYVKIYGHLPEFNDKKLSPKH